MATDKLFRRPALAGLLDDGLLAGQHEVTTRLRPERTARPVPTGDVVALAREMHRAVQVWGGASLPLLPVIDGRLHAEYERLLGTGEVDFVGGLTELDVALPPRVKFKRPWDHPALAVAAAQPADQWKRVRVADLDERDPWRPIYDALLGWWPDEPDQALGKFAGVREDLAFEDVVPLVRERTAGSLQDLIDRLTTSEYLTPRFISNFQLAYGLQPDASFLGAEPGVLPNPRADQRAAGPNIVVAISEGSVEDLALLWNLRGAHGDSHVMPIGVPWPELDSDGLRELQQPGRAIMFGFGGGACYLTSTTVPTADLKACAADVPSVRVAPFEKLLTFGPAPGRYRSHVRR